MSTTRGEVSRNVGSELLFENDRVRVWSMTLAPGESCEYHRHENDIEGTKRGRNSPASPGQRPRPPGPIAPAHQCAQHYCEWSGPYGPASLASLALTNRFKQTPSSASLIARARCVSGGTRNMNFPLLNQSQGEMCRNKGVNSWSNRVSFF